MRKRRPGQGSVIKRSDDRWQAEVMISGIRRGIENIRANT